MTTFVLIHGAWHGGWCWQRVAPLLRAQGHEVLTPSLSGMGENAHMLSPQITLETHVQDVVNVCKRYEVKDAVLVGHSYGGMMITGAADRLHGTNHLSKLVYLDATVPHDNWRWSDSHKPEQIAARHAAGRGPGLGLCLPVPEAAAFGVTDKADLAWVDRNLRPHPYGTYLSSLSLPELAKGGGAAALPRTYIDCTKPFYSDFNGLKGRLKADKAWKYIELATCHDAMVTMPKEVAELLMAA
jgi:pimeloyl-ACP methyl ester carboxylesterase